MTTKERGRDTHGEANVLQSQPQDGDAGRNQNVDSCESPFGEAATDSAAVAMDARLIPKCATLSVCAFALVCRDDRVETNGDGDHDAATLGLKPDASLGKLEISSGNSDGVLALDVDNMKPSFVAATAATAGAKQTSLAASWNTLATTPGELSSVPESKGLGLAKPELSKILKHLFSRDSVRRVAPMGAQGSLCLGEVQIRCRPLEAGAPQDAENSPTASSCVVIRDISVIPSVVVVKPRQPGERNLTNMPAESRPARGSLAGGRGAAQESKPRESTGNSSSGCTSNGDPDDKVRLPPRQSPPPLPLRPPPPQPLPPMRSQSFQVPEMKVHAGAITGKVDAGLAGWLNLRGLHEAELLAAKERRIAELVAAGKQRKELGCQCWTSYLQSRLALVSSSSCCIAVYFRRRAHPFLGTAPMSRRNDGRCTTDGGCLLRSS